MPETIVTPTISIAPAVDPVTAALQAAAALFTFLSTPAGQRVVNDLITLDEQFAHEVKDVWTKIHQRVTA